MLIYTSYFAQVRNLPSDIVPISIAAKQVPGWRYPVYGTDVLNRLSQQEVLA